MARQTFVIKDIYTFESKYINYSMIWNIGEILVYSQVVVIQFNTNTRLEYSLRVWAHVPQVFLEYNSTVCVFEILVTMYE